MLGPKKEKMLLFFLLTFLRAFAINSTSIVHTQYGDIQGIVSLKGVQQYFGIPFAAPPVGDLR
jgi:hypothetical protein